MAEVIAALNEPPIRDPNDPCKSNDVDNWALTQTLFGRTTNDETGEEEDDDGNFLLNPCFVDEENATSESPTTVEPSSKPTPRPSPPPSLPPSAMPTRKPSPPPTTAVPTTESPTTAAPSTRKPTRRPSPSPSSSPSTRPSPSPITPQPSTAPPYTTPPITAAPITPSPTSAAPSKEPTTESPTEAPFYTKPPTTAAPSLKPTKSPSTESPTTAAPITESPTTASPSRKPTTASPSREPSTQSPTPSPSGELIVTPTTSTTTEEASETTTSTTAAQAETTTASTAWKLEVPMTPTTTTEESAESITTTVSTSEFITTASATQDEEAATFATTFPSDEEPRSFYSCSNNTNGNGGSSSSSSNGNPAVPPDTTQLTVTYDYELHTSSPFNADILNSFENSIAQDLAGRYGLINCGVEPTLRRGQRYLRSFLKQGGVVALDSKPVDESLADTYECEVPAVNLDASSTSCTSIRGYMTAHLPNSSSADDTAETEAQLLALIQNGMQSDSYTSDDVVKASYVGVREVDDGSSQDDGQSSGNTAGDDNGNANGVVADSPATGNPNIDGAKETDTGKVDSSSTTPLLAIGISIFLLASLLAIALAVYMRKKRRRSHFYSDGPNANNDMGNNNVGHRPNSVAAQAAMAEPPPRDPDDVHLLSSPDKFDMRSVYSEDMSTDVETENYTYENYNTDQQGEEKSHYGDVGAAGVLLRTTSLSSLTVDYGNNFAEGGSNKNNNGDTPKSGSSRTSRASAGSALAAMGVASTLVTKSYTPTSTTHADPASPATSEDSPQATQVGASSGAYSESNSHVGTVEEEEEGSASVASVSVSTPNEEKEGTRDQKLTSDSSSMSSTEGGGGAFQLDS